LQEESTLLKTRTAAGSSTMSTALADLVECMVQAHHGDAYDAAFCDLEEAAEYMRDNCMGKVDELWSQVNNCIPEILSRMHSDLNNQKLQQRCERVLGCLQIVLIDLNGRNDDLFKGVLRFVQERPEDPSAARFGFGIIKHDFIEKDYERDEDIDDPFSSIVIDSMIRHESDPVVQEYAMSCMNQYFRLFPGRERDSRATRIFLQAMRSHPDNLRVQVEAWNAIRFSVKAIILEEWPPVTILQAMINHPQCAEVQAIACFILMKMFDFDGGFGEVRTVLTGQDYVQPILRATENHYDNKSVQMLALRALREMTTESSTFTHIIQGGGVEFALRAMRNFYHGAAIDAAVIILERLFGSSVDSRRTAIASDAIPLLLLHMCDSTRSKTICTALNYLFLENADIVSLQIARENSRLPFIGIKSIVDGIIKSVGPGVEHPYVLADDIMLAHLAMLPSSNGILPLHFAAFYFNDSGEESRRGGQVAVVDYLLNAYPEAMTIRDGNGCFPLHLAIAANAPLWLSVRLAAFPSVAGTLPLHYAVAWRNDSFYSFRVGQVALVEHLLEEYPEAATIRDGSGRLPLHVAIEANASISILETLLRATPAAGEAVCRCEDDVMFNFPPALMAAANDCDLESIFMLLRYVPTITKTQGTTSVNRKRKSHKTIVGHPG
jgi:hypothetical protein